MRIRELIKIIKRSKYIYKKKVDYSLGVSEHSNTTRGILNFIAERIKYFGTLKTDQEFPQD